jgi:glycosidase
LSILGEDLDRYKLALLFQMTFPGAPCIYYGDEVGMTSVPVQGQEGRATMSWDQDGWDLELRDTVKRYIALRKAHPALRRGAFIPLYASSKRGVYAFLRRSEDEALVVILNVDEAKYKVHIPVEDQLLDGTHLQDQVGNEPYEVQGGYIVGASMPPLSGLALLVCQG